MVKIKKFLALIGNLILVIWGISLLITLIFGIFTSYSMIHFFGLLIDGIIFIGIPMMIVDVFRNPESIYGNSGNNSRKNHSHGSSSASNSGYAPYQGDKSMVGGVVGGSITPPVGGRAGQ